jgi:hypothetical protein
MLSKYLHKTESFAMLSEAKTHSKIFTATVTYTSKYNPRVAMLTSAIVISSTAVSTFEVMNHRTVTACNNSARSQVSACGICGGQNSIGKGFSQSPSGFSMSILFH